jgi:hypothetical protein
MTESAPAEGYLDGAPAEEAFQKLVDRGLLSDTPPEPAVAPAAAAAPDAPEAASAQEDAPEPPAEPEAEEYRNLDEYLTKAQLDREAFMGLPVKVKVDGRESEIPLKDVLRSYQLDAHVTQKSQAFAEQQRTWEAEQAQAKQAISQQFQLAQQLGNLAHQQLLAEFQGVDWNKLRMENPTEWAVRNQEFQMRAGAIQQHLAQIDQRQQQEAAEAQQRQQAALEVERAKTLETFPEWKDPAKFQAARTELTSYAKSIGFNDAELAGIADHRYMKVLHDASRYAALQAKSPAVLKLVRAAPPMAQPGARITRDPKTARLQQVREAARGGKLARNEDAQAAAFSALVDAGA